MHESEPFHGDSCAFEVGGQAGWIVDEEFVVGLPLAEAIVVLQRCRNLRRIIDSLQFCEAADEVLVTVESVRARSRRRLLADVGDEAIEARVGSRRRQNLSMLYRGGSGGRSDPPMVSSSRAATISG